ncbi:MAG: sulfotransferase family protein, partial [Halothece sp.]
MTNPVIVVGLPRSGSTLLTRVLNETSKLFIVNDFYYLQYIDSVDGFDSVNQESTQEFAKAILKKIKSRIEREDSPELECGLYFSVEDEEKLEQYVEELCQEGTYTWYELLEKIMSYSASLLDKTTWGYNTPQDFLHIDRLEKHFPEAKFIYMMRDPRSVLRSYKNVQSNGYHDKRRYHPIIQALAWRTAMRSFTSRKNADNCMLIRYEDFTTNPDVELRRIGDFLGMSFQEIDINQFGNNSSFKGRRKKTDLTETEVAICEKITQAEMEKTNYSLSQAKPRLEDFCYLSKITKRVANFYLAKTFASSDV